MPRIEFTRKQRAEIWLRANGHCEGCSAKLKAGEAEFDHVIPFALTRETTVENGQLLCRVCHKGKTHGEDRPRISKAERQRAKFLGIWPKSKTPLKSRGFERREDQAHTILGRNR